MVLKEGPPRACNLLNGNFSPQISSFLKRSLKKSGPQNPRGTLRRRQGNCEQCELHCRLRVVFNDMEDAKRRSNEREPKTVLSPLLVTHTKEKKAIAISLASPQGPPTASNSSARALSATGPAPASAEG